MKNHITALSHHCENDVFHIQVKQSRDLLKIEKTDTSRIYFSRYAKYYRVQEWLTFFALFRLFFIQRRAKGVDAINFHIATPLCRYINFFNFFVKKKMVITEHWTAYYRHFGLPKNHKGIRRVKRIFHQSVDLIVVSDALGKDIQRFSGNMHLNYHVVPNVVNAQQFYFEPKVAREKKRLFMVTNWSPEKNPFPILTALSLLSQDYDFELHIAGDGELLPKMEAFLAKTTIKVVYHGRISPHEVGEQFRSSDLFLHAAHYETFSVVCAESLCCGCPVIVSNIPAIMEYVDAESGIAVSDFETQLTDEELAAKWQTAIKQYFENPTKFNREVISQRYTAKFSEQEVGRKYYQVLSNLS